jgi:hypothetical protein
MATNRLGELTLLEVQGLLFEALRIERAVTETE